jgi:predicted nuclease of predicted toxin-antitoxin system
VRFLIDASLSFRIAEALQKAGHDAVHVKDVLTVDAPDHTIFDYAARDDRVVVSADTDFGELLARRGTPRPSLILLRRRTRGRPSDQSMLLLTQLPAVSGDLEAGAVVVIEEARVRIRSLPVDNR